MSKVYMLHRLYIFCVLVILGTGSSCEKQSKSVPNVIFDAEMSGSDLMSLYLFNRSTQVNLLGVTISGIQAPLLQGGAMYAEKVLTLAHKTNIPVSAMSTPPLCPPPSFPGYKEEDLSTYKLPTPAETPLDMSGSALMTKLLTESTDKVTILSLGPLNNLAHLLLENPLLKEKIERVIMLAGSIHTTQGVVLPFDNHWKTVSLYNSLCDPCSANVVITSGVPITLIPLDVISVVLNTPGILKSYGTAPPKNPGAQFVLDILKDYSTTNWGFAVFWDMIGVMAVTNPQLLTLEEAYITVLTEPGPSFGYVISSSTGTLVSLCTAIDRERFFQQFFKMMND